MTNARPWLAAVLVLFCFPLFVNLGQDDLANDEAIYAFAIDRMIGSGDWLVPKALPHDDLAFFEKPPLKFWIAAAPIRAGLLPHDEFGLRFWDALFGAAAFVYVFLIGTWLLNPICGAVAVLLLFAHPPLLFGHGLRSNNMESALVLAYCGGVYHYLAWAGGAVRLKADRATGGLSAAGATPAGVPIADLAVTGVVSGFGRTLHPLAVALCFVLGFMTKFVAALFLPAVLGVTALAVRDHRRLLVRDWRAWGAAAVLAMAAIAPWFVFASVRFGRDFWNGIVGVHVVQRFTSYVDPGHLRPWSFYFTEMVAFWDSAALVLMFAGLVVLAAWTARRFAPDVMVIVLWFALPMVLISAGTSKLYHYAYPFLPALALAGGYLAALMLALGPAPFDRALERFYARAAEALPRVARLLRRPAARTALMVAIGVCVALAAGSLWFGQVRLVFGSTELTSAGILRPGMAAFVFAVLLGIRRSARRSVLALLVTSVLPLQGYRDSLMLLGMTVHPKRSTSDCIRDVQARVPDLPRGLRADLPEAAVSQSLFYYFDRIGPWSRGTSDGRLPALKLGPAPALVTAVGVGDDVVVLLPGPYAQCGEAATRG